MNTQRYIEILTHTPGPWRVSDALTDIEIVTDCPPGNESECIVRFKGQKNARANAQLMAAAPELLNALEQMLEADGELDAMDFDQARDALDKATMSAV